MKKEHSILLTQTRPPSTKEIEFWKHKEFTTLQHQSLLDVKLLPVKPLNIAPQAIVLTSSNAALALEHSDWDRSIPVYAVGNATASKVKSIGFTNSSSPSDNPYPSALHLIEWIKENLHPNHGPIIFGCGNHIRHDVAEILSEYGFETTKIILYTTESATGFNKEIEEALRNNNIGAVVINSETALSTFANLCFEQNINTQPFQIFVPSKFLKNCALTLDFLNVSIITQH